MPRIPSSADVNPVGGSAGRLPSVRADAADFGLSIAQGLSAFGQGLGDVGGRLSAEARREAAEQEAGEDPSKKNQLAETTGFVKTRKLQAKARMIGDDLIGGMERGAQTPGLAAQDVIEEFDRSVKNLVAALPSEWQALVTTAIAPVREGVVVRARRRAHNLAVEGVMQDTQEILQSLTMLALREPEAAEIYLAEGEALLQSHVRTGALTQEQFAAQSRVFRRSLYTKLLRSQSAIDAVADLKAGVYDEALDDPALKELLLRESSRRLELERAQGIAGTNWLVARARRGATTPDALTERSVGVLGAVGWAEGQKGLDRVRRVNSELEALRYAPEAMLWQGVAELPLAWGAEDSREVLEVQEEFRVQAEEMLRRRREDPAAYVMNLPGLSEAFAAAEADPALLAEAITERLAAQEAMGLTPDEQNALTQAERRQIIAGLQQLAPEQRAAALQELQQAYGEQAGAVVADLAEAGFSVDEVLVTDPSGGPEVTGRLAQARESQGQARSPEAGGIEEAAEKLIAEGRTAATDLAGEERRPPEDMEFSLPSSRPKPNPLRADESIEGRLHIPKLSGTPREQAQTLIARLGVSIPEPREPILEPLLDALKDIAQIRYIVRDEGGEGMKRLRTKLQKLSANSVGHGLHDSFGFDLALFSDEVLRTPYKHPWSLSDIELTSSIGALAERLRDSANQSASLELFSTFVELFAPVGRIKQGIGLALGAVGLSDSIDTATAQKEFWHLVNEAIHRKIIVVDSRAIKGAGL